MKLIMTLLVRDEEDIVGANIDFHLSRGVDFIIAMNNLSVDKTPEILRHYETRGLLHYIEQFGTDHMQFRWVTEMARLACTTYSADWIINNDGDEFWYPEAGDLKQVLKAVHPQYDAVTVPRTNFLPRPMHEGAFFADAMVVRQRVSLNSLDQPLPEKICHRAYPDIEIEQGNHWARRSGCDLSLTTAPITILHFPMRSFRQFSNKIIIGGAAYERNTVLRPDIGGTWRYLYQMWKNGDLEAYYKRSTPNDEELNMGIKEGRYIFDDRLKRALASIHDVASVGGLARE